MKHLVALFLALSVSVACRATDFPTPGEADSGLSVWQSDAPTESEEVGAEQGPCAAACANLKKLGCPEAAPNPGGDSCYLVCARAQASAKIPMRPLCLTKAASQDEARACGTVRCGQR